MRREWRVETQMCFISTLDSLLSTIKGAMFYEIIFKIKFDGDCYNIII